MNRKFFALKERVLRDQCAHLENEIQILNGVVVDVTVKAEQQELVLGEQSVRIRELGTEVRSLTDQLAFITELRAKTQHDLEQQRVARAVAEQFAVNLVQLKANAQAVDLDELDEECKEIHHVWVKGSAENTWYPVYASSKEEVVTQVRENISKERSLEQHLSLRASQT